MKPGILAIRNLQFFSAYYVANIAALAAYGLSRLHYLRHGDPKFSRLADADELWNWEHKVLSFLVVVLFTRLFRHETVAGFCADVLTYAKLGVALLVYMQDTRIFCHFLLLFAAIFLLYPEPWYSGPTKVEYVNPALLADLIRTPGQRHLVAFLAPWGSRSRQLDSVLASLSLEHASESLHFGKMDITRWPGYAKELRIQLGMASQQLPTLIMFEEGKEIGRIPVVYENGSVAKARMRRVDIVHGFELGQRRPEAGGSSGGSKPAGRGGGSRNATKRAAARK